MILSGNFNKLFFLTAVICLHNETTCTFFNFARPETIDYSRWVSVTDQVRGGSSSANMSNILVNGVNVASFDYNLVPLPNGACFASVYYMGAFNAGSYDGISIKLKRTGKNEWFKVIFMQEHSYEHFFKAPESFEEMKFPFSSFLPYHWGKRVNTSRPLDRNDLRFGLQVFGGVFEDFKQKGNGSLQIEWVKAYKI